MAVIRLEYSNFEYTSTIAYDHLMRQQKLLRLLKQVRQEAGLTQSQLAAKLGESQPYVSKYETGEQRLDLLEVEKICDAVGVGLIPFIKRYLDDAKSEVPINSQEAVG